MSPFRMREKLWTDWRGECHWFCQCVAILEAGPHGSEESGMGHRKRAQQDHELGQWHELTCSSDCRNPLLTNDP